MNRISMLLVALPLSLACGSVRVEPPGGQGGSTSAASAGGGGEGGRDAAARCAAQCAVCPPPEGKKCCWDVNVWGRCAEIGLDFLDCGMEVLGCTHGKALECEHLRAELHACKDESLPPECPADCTWESESSCHCATQCGPTLYEMACDDSKCQCFTLGYLWANACPARTPATPTWAAVRSSSTTDCIDEPRRS